jgi:hypothetical protein
MLEILLEEIDQMPKLIIHFIFICQSDAFLMGNYYDDQRYDALLDRRLYIQ